jgi:hypothetical protein
MPNNSAHFSPDPVDMAKSDEGDSFGDRPTHTAKFILDLAKEGERAAVVLGASRADSLLEELLKAALRPHPGSSDNLFDPDRPLGTFSARISLAFRMGLVDEACEHALQMLRKIRNDFAHSATRASLDESRHRSRVLELVREAKKGGKSYDQMVSYFHKCEPTLQSFCAAVSLVIARLEVAATQAKQVAAPFTAKVNHAT